MNRGSGSASRLRNIFREEPAVGNDPNSGNSQVNIEDSVLNILDRFSSMRAEDHINES